MDAGYRILPPIYDRWQKVYGRDFSTLILPRLLSTLRSHRIGSPVATSPLKTWRPGGRSAGRGSDLRMVDLACGTGTLAHLMARRGWEVYGVDASEGMIREAVKKFAALDLPVHFLHQDMRSFILPERVILVTSFFDSLNHLLENDDLLAAFRRTNLALASGGWFVFDVNNELCFSTLWTKSEVVNHRDFTLHLDCSYDRRRGIAKCDVTLRERNESGGATQLETVCERMFSPEEIRELLGEAGFAVREMKDFNFTANPAIGNIKTWCVAEKRNAVR